MKALRKPFTHIAVVAFIAFGGLGLSAPYAARALDYKPIELDSNYQHDRWITQPQDIMREFRAFVLSFDGADDDDGDGDGDRYAIPHWVAYEIKAFPGELGAGPERPSSWLTDRELFEDGVAAGDASYKFSRDFRRANPESPQLGYDRGHMCMKLHAWRLGVNADWNTHTTLNACPQQGELNQGIWLDLEKRTADWADRYGRVWIVAGPVIYGAGPSLWLGEDGEVPVAVPDAFFKLVIREEDGVDAPEVLAFLYPQFGIGYKESGGYDHAPYLTSVDVLEALTGLDFLTALDDETEARVERTTAVELWP
ncbi:MAG: DNA/RNA non-specific endonuclease [Acidobacteriota bacterium]